MVAFENEPDVPEKRRAIHYIDDEDVARDTASIGPRANRKHSTSMGPRMSHQLSTASTMSIHSVHSRRRRSVNPAHVLPVHYRTLSIGIEDSKSRDVKDAARTRDHVAAEIGDLDWHKISIAEVYGRLRSSPEQGISTEQVARLVTEYGRNVPSPPPSHLARDIFGYMFGGFGSILLTGSILVFVAWKPLGQPPQTSNLALAIVLLVVFIVQAVFNAWQDWSSSRVMASITSMLPEACMLLRNGVQTQVAGPDVVPGDVLFVKAGNKLPADVRFVEISSDAKFDRSILTGESMPISGSTECTDENLLETHNIGMQGTHCISGSGIGVVIATGDRTIFGRIAKLTNAPNTAMSNLQKEILRFVIIIVSLMLLMNVIVVIVWLSFLRKQHPTWILVPNLIVDLVTIAIAFVPEGLPIALTASLTITASIMKKNNVLCKSLKTVETLGAVSIICSDKTGTLTKNQMTATNCLVGTTSMTAQDAFNSKEHLEDSNFSSTKQLHALAGLCNAGEFEAATTNLPLKDRVIIGDATDQAVLRFSEGLGSVHELRNMWRKRFDLAFNSKNKFMIRIFSALPTTDPETALSVKEAEDFRQSEDMLLTIKGGPDVLIGRCTSIVNIDGTLSPLDSNTLATIESIKDAWSNKGKRVILLARKVLPAHVIKHDLSSGHFEIEAVEHAKTNLTFVGLIGIVDPPRDEIPEVCRTLRRAGIRIFMVTGDFKLTAQAIARDCGIITNPPDRVDDCTALSRDAIVEEDFEEKRRKKHAVSRTMGCEPEVSRSIVLSGPELIVLNDNQWSQLATYDEVVFARTTPEQKLRIVREYQARDHLVAMTGDGVNDAPSLKAADIGIAPGSGSDIAIEAADMILLDSFSAIVEAVMFGRVVFINLKKTICYLLPAGTFSEFWPIMTNVIFGLPQILSSFLMIVICCFTDCAAATTLAYEKPERDVMLRPPRDPKRDRLVDWKLLLQSYGFMGTMECVSSFAMAYWYCQRKGVTFGNLWFKYGAMPEGLNQEYVQMVLNEASSIYFVNLVVMQWFNLMALRTRNLSIFQHPPAFNKMTQNLYLFPAILFALVFAFIFLYIPGLQRVIATTTVPVEHWFLPMAFGAFILLADESRKACVRKWPGGFLARIAW
ncbi:hypothetical protein MMC25_000602 [Agyrium rufum]|nr:hypothetical protein [Agyrium rufum]